MAPCVSPVPEQVLSSSLGTLPPELLTLLVAPCYILAPESSRLSCGPRAVGASGLSTSL